MHCKQATGRHVVASAVQGSSLDGAGEGSSQQDGKRKRASQKEKPAQKLGTAKAGAEQGVMRQPVSSTHRLATAGP